MEKSKQRLLDERYLRMARIWAENSYCVRRQVGALIVRGNAIISDGYNGLRPGLKTSVKMIGIGRSLMFCMQRRMLLQKLQSRITVAWGPRYT